MDDFRELLMGCGSRREKFLFEGDNRDFHHLTTLDINTSHHPDVVHDLNVHPLPFLDHAFDEIHAYDVLEHLGSQGDYAFFFSEFSEYWRILKPNGRFFATVPATRSAWVWGDPSHTRYFAPPWLLFLSQRAYDEQIGQTSMSDFRYLYKADFVTEYTTTMNNGETFAFVLRAVKPS